MERNKKYYECLNYSKYRKIRCVYNSVPEDYILENFKVLLKELRTEYKDFLQEMNVDIIKIKSKDNRGKLKIKLDKVKNEYKTIQVQQIKELAKAESVQEKEIIEEAYSELIKDKMNEMQEITKTLDKLEKLTDNQKVNNLKNAIDYFDDIIKLEIPSKQVLAQVLEKVIITKNKNLEFKLKINIDEMI